MKKLTALFVAVALLSPAFAQKLTFQGTHPRPKLTAMAPAYKPVLLHTGKPITADQKRQLMTTVVRASAPKGSGGTVQVKDLTQSAGTTVLTPDQLFQNGVSTMLSNPYFVDTSAGILTFMPGDANSLTIVVPVNKNTAYTLVMKVIVGSYQNPQMTIVYPGGSVQNSEILTVSGGENEFAYAFTSNSTGATTVTFYSTNSNWSFESCEITSAAF
ncbi:MAG: hypothetical protein ABSC47_00285 [Terracidiphilus sp.]|jgi:hypothetical protein